MKRLTRQFLICFILGFLANLLLAYLAAVVMPRSWLWYSDKLTLKQQQRTWEEFAPADWKNVTWNEILHRNRYLDNLAVPDGISLNSSHDMQLGLTAKTLWLTMQPEIENVTTITDNAVIVSPKVTIRDVTVTEISAGFPIPCFRGGISRIGWPGEIETDGGIVFESLPISSGSTYWKNGVMNLHTDCRLIPLQPNWFAITFNTIFLATALWIILFGWIWIRAGVRVLSHRCARCGYPLLLNRRGCPECGWRRVAGDSESNPSCTTP